MVWLFLWLFLVAVLIAVFLLRKKQQEISEDEAVDFTKKSHDPEDD